jgi:hypothetical protein
MHVDFAGLATQISEIKSNLGAILFCYAISEHR